MRSEEKENFRLVNPMMTAVMCEYAELIRVSRIDPLQMMLLSGHCASNAQQLEKWVRRAKLQQVLSYVAARVQGVFLI